VRRFTGVVFGVLHVVDDPIRDTSGETLADVHLEYQEQTRAGAR
jgi:hypothetical protein